MKETLERVRATSDGPSGEPGSLRRPSDELLGVFPARTFNLDMQSISWPHTDQGNLAHGWCSITPLGTFNSVMGGHLILWDLGIVAEFPSGCTALIPSSIIRHSNTSLLPGEVRHVIVQYASGSLFRWAHNNLMPDQQRLRQAEPEDQDRMRREEQERRWREAVASFTTMDELRANLRPG
jgi:hypothetical protein